VFILLICMFRMVIGRWMIRVGAEVEEVFVGWFVCLCVFACVWEKEVDTLVGP